MLGVSTKGIEEFILPLSKGAACCEPFCPSQKGRAAELNVGKEELLYSEQLSRPQCFNLKNRRP